MYLMMGKFIIIAYCELRSENAARYPWERNEFRLAVDFFRIINGYKF